MRTSVWSLRADGYPPHELHSDRFAWLEKNCYVDLWIEVLHAAGLNPFAMLGSALSIDFDGEQWTFYKPSHRDLLDLYGVEVRELSVFRPLLEHVQSQTAAGRLVLTEADAWWLPDTRGTDYRTQHTKTTIAIETIDIECRRLGYFHNAGYFQLDGEDFDRLFSDGTELNGMPFFAEVADFSSAMALPTSRLAARSATLMPRWLDRVPRTNPIARFAAHLVEELPAQRELGLEHYHRYAFATIRQAGSSYELAAAYLRWLDEHCPTSYGDAAHSLDLVSAGMKALILKGARAVRSTRPVDVGPMLADMAAAWERAFEMLGATDVLV